MTQDWIEVLDMPTASLIAFGGCAVTFMLSLALSPLVWPAKYPVEKQYLW